MSDNNNINIDQIKELINSSLQEVLKSNTAIQNNSVNNKSAELHQNIVEDRKTAENDKKRIEKEKQDAVFLSTIYSNIEKDQVFLPDDFKKVTDACIRAGETDEYKVQLIKKEHLERFFELQEHIDLLSDEGRKKINEFNALTSEGKLHKAESVYGLISDVVNVKKNMYLSEEKKRQKNIDVGISSKQTPSEVNRLKKSQDFLLGVSKVFSMKD